jgi:two-component system phosphate regulon sensor histidine kinase PhoR
VLFFRQKRRWQRILDALEKIKNGELNQRLHLLSGGDIGALAEAINQMAEVLEARLRALEKETRQFRSILNSMAEGVVVVDRDTRIISLNPAAEKIFQAAQREAQEKLFLETFRNNDIAEVINVVLEKGELVSREMELVWPLKKVFMINASPILENDNVAGCLLVIHDISEIRRLEKVRADFIANASHELKTPLTSIKGFVETLRGGALEDKEVSRDFLRIIAEHSERLDKLINDLLHLTRLESKEAALEKKGLDLSRLVGGAIADFQGQLRKKNITVKNDLPQPCPAFAEQDKMEQVFANLLDNAIKYNKDGGWVKIYSQDIREGIKVTVEDSGYGIPARDIPRIFERFYRVDKARSRELGGTGLGLAIVKHIIELHGGCVGVESTEGLGSKFWFTLSQQI